MKHLISFFFRFTLGLLPLSIPDFSYILKWITTLIYIRIYRRLKKGRLDFYDLKVKAEPENVGFIEHPTEIQMESPRTDSHLAKGDDKIFFYGVSSKKEFFLASIVRLPNAEAEANLCLRLSNGKIYQLEKNLDFQQSTGNKRAFSCGGLQMHYLCAMRRWRIFFSGYLRETSADDPLLSKMVYVKFAFIWRASSDVYDNTTGMNEATVAQSVASVEWKSIVPPVNRLHKLLDFYGQAGVIRGTVCVEGGVQDHEIYLFGEKMRYIGDMSMTKGADFSVLLGHVHKNGSYIHVGRLSAPNITKDITFGFIVKPSAEIKNVEKVEIIEDSKDWKVEEVKGTFMAAKRSYIFTASMVRSVCQVNSNIRSMQMNEVELYLNGKKGVGIYIQGKTFETSSTKVIDLVPETSIPDLLFPMVVLFNEHLCKLPEITGGKGSCLGKLTQLSGELKMFTVPSFMVVTTSSYREFITKDILHEIRYLEETLYGNIKGDPKEACKRVYGKIITAKLSNNIRDNIVKNLKKIFGDKYSLKKLAVRSSAIGEDTEQMSAAGQMDTFLGVSGLSNIILALKKCWASQFSFTSVQYKRRYGQCLNTPMAVVIQEMVPCDVAGVLFTCNPVDGNPTKMSIAANFGLGESVVSGSEEPDSVELSRDHNNELRVSSVTVGSKNRKIIVTDSGISVDEIPEDERHKCCLTNENALELGKIAIEVEKNYRSRRDIEWGIHNNKIHIFQCRPVTSGTEETDFEIEHELDGPMRVENDYFSVSNTGEVMPGAFSYLSIDTFFRSSNIVWQGESETDFQLPVKTRYFPLGWMTMSNHGMFSICDMFRDGDPENQSEIEKASMIAFFGRVLTDKDIYQAAADRYAGEEQEGLSYITLTNNFYKRQKALFLAQRRLKRAQKMYANYRIPVEKYNTAKDLFHILLQRCGDLGEAMMCHMFCSQSSTQWNNYLITTLLQAKKGMDNDVYADFANLITSKGDVESADVPSAIQNLAIHITKSVNTKEFKAMKVEDALLWLQKTSTEAGKKFNNFLHKHGHRCLKEFDIYSVPWGSDPKPLVKILQNLVGEVRENEESSKNVNVIKQLSQIKIPLGFLDKLKLIFYVPFSREAVRLRESSKSLLIKGIDAWRKAYRSLAKLMVSEGRIPNENLLFFMTIEEIKELLEDRQPRILAKAYHRQRLHPKMESYMYPEIMSGIPKPINLADDRFQPQDGPFSMEGIPVSRGVAKGYLRVATSLEDAAGLKPGEIMLAYSTDIGWTPYFPSLAGVATELGGLISHGAVVSREYGLPCVAGLHGATRRFKTGDYVFLDGNKGILQKLQDPNEL